MNLNPKLELGEQYLIKRKVEPSKDPAPSPAPDLIPNQAVRLMKLPPDVAEGKAEVMCPISEWHYIVDQDNLCRWGNG